jgi:hypothetical protein
MMQEAEVEYDRLSGGKEESVGRGKRKTGGARDR